MTRDRDFDLVVFGATGLTGRLVVEQIAGVDALLRGADGMRRWAVAGRDRARIARVLADLSLGDVEVVVADLDDAASLEAMAGRAAVVLNLAGPYTPKADRLIAACVEAGASYADLSGEIPLLRRVIDRFDAPARRAGVQVVQMAGWEAMPADLATLIACRRAAPSGAGEDGPGAAGPIAEVVVTIRFTRVPAGGVPFKQSVSAGTMASVVAMLDDAQAGLVGRSTALLPAPATAAGSAGDAMRFGAGVIDGRVLGPVVPVAFLNPPIIRRTAALLAAEHGGAYGPCLYREGVDIGPSSGGAGVKRKVRAAVGGAVQHLAVGLTRLPSPMRRAIARRIRARLPEAGTGPSGAYLRDWAWTVEARATARDGAVGTATIGGVGHPGYTATAAILVETALAMAERRSGRSGCITPALAIGSAVEGLRVGGLSLR